MTWREIFGWSVRRLLRGSSASYVKHRTTSINGSQAIYLDPPRSISEYIAQTEGRENRMHRAGVEQIKKWDSTDWNKGHGA